ncbi:MAG: hypothetical protein LBS87_00880 [Puniceicoccales bacterium]|jgi:hypothetical protein|nr:hypothetical protein [Puniceicoccales bacterium]
MGMRISEAISSVWPVTTAPLLPRREELAQPSIRQAEGQNDIAPQGDAHGLGNRSLTERDVEVLGTSGEYNPELLKKEILDSWEILENDISDDEDNDDSIPPMVFENWKNILNKLIILGPDEDFWVELSCMAECSLVIPLIIVMAKYPEEVKLIDQFREIVSKFSPDARAIISGTRDEIEGTIGDSLGNEVDIVGILAKLSGIIFVEEEIFDETSPVAKKFLELSPKLQSPELRGVVENCVKKIDVLRRILSRKARNLEDFGNVLSRELDTLDKFVQWVVERETFPSFRAFQEASDAIANAIAYSNTCVDALRTGMEELEFGLEVAKFGNSDMPLRDKLEILGDMWSTGTITSVVRKVGEIAAIQGLVTKESLEVGLLLRGIHQRMRGKPGSGITFVTEARKQIGVFTKALRDDLEDPLFGAYETYGKLKEEYKKTYAPELKRVEEVLANWNELNCEVKYEDVEDFLILILRARERDRFSEVAMGEGYLDLLIGNLDQIPVRDLSEDMKIPLTSFGDFMQGWVTEKRLMAEDGADKTELLKKIMGELELLKSPESLKCGEVLATMRDMYKMVDLDGFPGEEHNLLEVWLGPKLNQSIALQIMPSLCDEYAKESVI